MGAPRAIALCQNFSGAIEFQAGNWTESEKALRESIDLFHQIGAAGGEALSLQRLGSLQTEQGNLEEGLTILESGVVAAKQALLRAHLQGRLQASITRNRLLAGNLPAADHALALGFALTESHGHCPLCESLLLPVAVSVRIAQADLVGAEEFCRQLDAATNRYGSRTWVAIASQSRGELAAALGQNEAATNYYTAAQAGFLESKYVFAAAQCGETLARLQPDM